MIGFPFDSLVTYDEYGNPIFDRAVSSKPLKSLIGKLFTTGVMPNPSDNFQVFAGTEGMTVIVHAGFAVIEGGLKLEEDSRTLEVQASDTTYDRIDTVVLRWNGNDNARVCDLYILDGTPAPDPVRPELTRTGSIYEIGLADIIVPRNTGAISQQRITDTRYDSERCGIVSSVSEFDTTTLYAQVQADLADFKAEEQADFIVWYNAIKDRIDSITAETLQTQIDDINEPTITEASTRANIATGDTYPTILGKIKKFFTDLKSVAFSGNATDLAYSNGVNVKDKIDTKANQSDIAPAEASSTATSQHLTGSQFYFNGQLVTATADINVGGTIILNGNCIPSDCITKQLIDYRKTNTVKLWENLSSTSAFSPQDITLGDLSEYAYLAINTRISTSSASHVDTKLIPVVKDQITYMNWTSLDNTALENYLRSFTITDVTTGIVSISNCYKQRQGSAQTIDNNASIPVKIYGIYK